MEDRRAQLGLFWRDVAETAGLTTEGLRGMREGSKDIRPTTKTGVERALRWAYGSIEAVLSGGDPTPLADEPKTPARKLSYQEIEIREIRRIAEELVERTRRLEEDRAQPDADQGEEAG